MFDFLSWGHLLVIGLAALFIFGPERLPTLAHDAGRGLRRAREAIAELREGIHAELGDDFAELRDLDPRRYHPRTFLHAQLFGEDPGTSPGVRPTGSSLPTTRTDFAGRRSERPGDYDRSLPPPFDPDAT